MGVAGRPVIPAPTRQRMVAWTVASRHLPRTPAMTSTRPLAPNAGSGLPVLGVDRDQVASCDGPF
jgi:hypothetical protein